jgi:hypothetical protein
VPATVSGSKGAYLQRARFIAISEFGPYSLIYHEGRAYRVHKAKLPPGIRTPEGGKLPTATVYVCNECGAAHGSESERCHACTSPMAGVHPVPNVLRIDNVETIAAERITANNEDRERQGFEIQTVFAWADRDGKADVTEAAASDSEGPILALAYAPGATISRLNKGLRRRKEKTIFGFGIDPATGRWTGGAVDDDDDPPAAPDEAIKQRVVPIVQDYKNALLIRIAGKPLAEAGMTTLQHALSRGLEIVFQLEEGEIQTEPVPARDNRRGILAYEATEGGAGVLGRMTNDADALARVARAALELMHYRNIDAAVAAGDPALLAEAEDARCVKGCYRCLLSYYNQPDQEDIDRTDDAVRLLLLRLARSNVQPSTRAVKDAEPQTDWHAAVTRWGLPAPDPDPLTVNGTTFPIAWSRHLTAAAFAPVDAAIRAEADALGYAIVVLPEKPGEEPPRELTELLAAGT